MKYLLTLINLCLVKNIDTKSSVYMADLVDSELTSSHKHIKITTKYRTIIAEKETLED